MKNILIVEDEVLISEELKSILVKLGHKVVGEIYNGDYVSDKIAVENPDLVILDINIKGSKDGIEVGHDLNKSKVPHVFITSYSDVNTIQRVQSTKPYGYIVKPFTLDDVRVLLEMAFFRIERELSQGIPPLSDINEGLREKISNTEYEIIQDIFNGLTNIQVASKRYISVNTVKSHIRNIYRKLSVNSKASLIKKVMSVK